MPVLLRRLSVLWLTLADFCFRCTGLPGRICAKTGTTGGLLVTLLLVESGRQRGLPSTPFVILRPAPSIVGMYASARVLAGALRIMSAGSSGISSGVTIDECDEIGFYHMCIFTWISSWIWAFIKEASGTWAVVTFVGTPSISTFC